MRLLTPGPSLNTFSNVPSKPQCVHPSKSNLLPRQTDSLRIRLHPGCPVHTKHPCKFPFTAQSQDKDRALKVPLCPSVIRSTSTGTLVPFFCNDCNDPEKGALQLLLINSTGSIKHQWPFEVIKHNNDTVCICACTHCTATTALKNNQLHKNITHREM